MDALNDPLRPSLAQALGEAGARIEHLEEELAALHVGVGQLLDDNDQLRRKHEHDRERIRAIESSLDLLRHDTTRKRDLPKEADFEIFRLATDYTRFVMSDLMMLTDLALQAQGRHSADDTTPEEDEARKARELSVALLQNPSGPDREAVVQILGARNPPELTVALQRATQLRAKMAEHGARFDRLVTSGDASEGLPLWPSCRAGLVKFVVAPALVVGGRTIANSEGELAGPWVYTETGSLSRRASRTLP